MEFTMGFDNSPSFGIRGLQYSANFFINLLLSPFRNDFSRSFGSEIVSGDLFGSEILRSEFFVKTITHHH